MASDDGYDVFLSYAHSDGAAAAELNGWLSIQGLSTFFDRGALRPGLRWIPALEDAISHSKAVAILVGPQGIGNTQQYERELALVRQTQDAAFPVIPVLMPGCDSPPTGFLRLVTWVDLSKGTNVLQQTGGLDSLRAALRGEKVAASAIRASICPYRGLEPFREEDAAFFCGRDDAIRELIERVEEHSFVAVVGPSGSGKSSLVFAGLLPTLRKQSRTTMWDVVTLRPGKSPLSALAQAFGVLPDNAGPAAIDAYLEGEASAYRAGDADKLERIVDRRLDAAPEKPDRLLIYVDQWEELYAMAPSPEDWERFAQHSADVERFIALLAAASGAGSRANVVTTVRADFYNPLIRNPLLAALLPKQQVNIPPMGREDVRSAIETPAKTAGLSFAPPALVDRILDDVGLEEGRLPLLQFALKETWGKREGDKLTAEAYTAVGGVADAIEKTAEDAYERLTPAQKDAARRLFLRLVTPGEGQADTRARSAIPDDPEQRDIVNLFSNPKTRLLVTALQAAGPAEGKVHATVEVAHEALIQRWPTLRDWVRANRENMRARAAILRARNEWEEHGQDEKFLLDPGVQLERGRALLENPGDVAVDDIRDYVRRSIERDERRLAAEREADLADQRRIADARKRTAQVALAGLVVALLVAAAAIWQYFDANRANKEAVAQRDRAVLAEKAADRARLEAQANARKAEASAQEARANLREAQIAQEAADQSKSDALSQRDLAVQAQGEAIKQTQIANSAKEEAEANAKQAQAERDKSRVQLLAAQARREAADITSADAVERGGALALISIAKSTGPPDADAIEAARSALNNLPLDVLTHGGGRVTALAVLADGRLASGGEDGKIKLWPKEGHGEPTVLSHGAGVFSLAVLADGRLASGGYDGKIKLWPKEGKGEPTVLSHGGGPVWSLAALADGRLASGGDGAIKVWTKEAESEPVVLSQGGRVVALAVLADGQLAGGSGGAIKIWPTEGVGVPVVLSQGDWLSSLVALPDGRLASGGRDGTIKIWPKDGKGEAATLWHGAIGVSRLVVQADGRLASAGFDDMIKLWPKEGKGDPVVISHGSMVQSLAALPDGRLASGGDDGKIRIWPKEGASEPLVLRGASWVRSFAVLADGRLASASSEDPIRLWRMEPNETPVILSQGSPVWSLTALSNGRLASGGYDGKIKLWPKEGNGEPVVLQHGGPVSSLAALPDGRMASGGGGAIKIWPKDGGSDVIVLQHGAVALAMLSDGRLASGGGGTIKLWPVGGSGQPVVLQDGGQIVSLAALADGRLASAHRDGKIKLWPGDFVGPPELLMHGGLLHSVAALPDGRLASAGDDGAIKLWPKDGKGEPWVLSHGGAVWALAALPDGRLASGGLGGEIKLWLVDERKLLGALCLRAGRNLSKDEWAKYVGPDTPWRPSCGALGLPSNWRTPN